MTQPRDTQFLGSEFVTALIRAISESGAPPLSEEIVNKLARHYRMLSEWNRRLNLTRIVKPNDAARLHYAESIYAGRFIGTAKTLLDVGSGAGFPAIPLAVTNPSLDVVALESNQKKSVFLREVKDTLELANLQVIQARLEEFDWSGCDTVMSRALDRAADVYPEMIASFKEGSSLMLFCGGEMATLLGHSLPPGVRAEIHIVPGTDDRFIVLFHRS
jgi:16S rRNA (guanine(527)-N(7))-methyltransferase RsmG